MKKHLLIGLFMVMFASGFSQMAGWNQVVPLLVHEHSGSDVLNYQLRVTLDTQTPVSAGQMLSDGGDIRFSNVCSGGTVFPYWIESGMNTAATVIWVKIDTLYANESRTIYLHYGNPAAAGVSAVSGTFIGPHSGTDSTANTSLSGSSDAQRGFRFAPVEDILVTDLGKYTSSGNPRYVTLFDFTTQAVLRQTQVPGPVNAFSYNGISPIWLTQGTQYLAEIFCPAGDDSYYFGAAPTVGQHIQYFDMRYCNGCTQNTFPTNSLSGMLYGYVDFWYYTKTNVSPAPTYEWNGFTTDLADADAACTGDSLQLAVPINGGSAPFSYAWTGPVNDASSATPSVGVADTVEVFVTITDACGTSRMDSVTLNALPLPEVTISSSAPLICNGESAMLSVPQTTDTYLWENGATDTMIVVTPSVTTTYSVTATNTYGCSADFSYEQQVNVALTATHDVTICANQFYTVGANSYNQSGTYIDTIAGVTSCDSIVTTNLTVMPLPGVTDNIEICFGTTYTVGANTYSAAGTYVDTIVGNVCDLIVTTNLTITPDIDAEVQVNGLTLVADLGGDSYQWVDCANGNTPVPGATSNFYEATANGSYGVLVTVGNCTKLSNCVSITTVGIEENDLIENIAVFPNPNSGSFSVQSSKDQSVRVVNAIGQTVATAELTAGQAFQIDLKDADAGVYFVVSQTKVVRVVVE